MHALTVAFQHRLAKGVDVIGQDHVGSLPDDIQNSSFEVNAILFSQAPAGIGIHSVQAIDD
jgi:hypothetical protein